MAGPWESYQQADGPWTQYAQATNGDGVAIDVAKSAAAGIGKGVAGMVGLVGDFDNYVGQASDWLASKIMSPEKVKQIQAIREQNNPGILPTYEGTLDKIKSVTGEFHKPETTTGRYAETVGEMVPAVATGPGGLARRALQAVGAGVGSEAAGSLTKGSELEPVARFGGALVGGGLPSTLRRVVTPLPSSPARAELVNTLRNEGVTDLTAGQRSGSRPLQWLESSLSDAPLSGRGAPTMMERQAEQFTQAALRRAGSNANRATPEMIDEAFNRIGGQFDDLAARNNLHADARLSREVGNAVMDYENLVPPSQRAPIVGRLADDVRNSTGVIAGDRYQGWRSTIERLARGSSNNPDVATALRGIKNALDDAMERSIALRRPADLGAWRDARNQYRNLLVLERAATGAGAQAAEGLISPSQLRNAVVAQGRRAYARGQGDFADLARAGEAIMKPLPQSGTAPRLAANAIPAAIGAMVGGGEGAIAGTVAGAAAPGIAGRALMSRPVQAYLGNQLIQAPNATPTAAVTNLMQALIAARQPFPALGQ
jgi:hypothetical protein